MAGAESGGARASTRAPQFAGLIMRSRCLCENDTLCAGCGQPLAERRVNANYYDVGDRHIWHVPAFKAFDHRCFEESTKELVENRFNAKPEARRPQAV